MTNVFFVIGSVGLVVLALSLILDDLFEFAFDSDDFLSGPVIGAFITSFGFGGAALSSAGVRDGFSVGGGLVAGVVLAGIAGVVMRYFEHMPTDPSVRTDDFSGLVGAVVTDIVPPRIGEISVRHMGQVHKLSARCATRVPAGETVRITHMESPTMAVVSVPTPPNGDPR